MPHNVCVPLPAVWYRGTCVRCRSRVVASPPGHIAPGQSVRWPVAWDARSRSPSVGNDNRITHRTGAVASRHAWVNLQSINQTQLDETRPQQPSQFIAALRLSSSSTISAYVYSSLQKDRDIGQRSFTVSGPITLWNSLPLSVYEPSLMLTQFYALFTTVLFCREFYKTPT